MATQYQQQQPTINVDLPGTAITPGAAALARMPQVSLPIPQAPSKEVEYVGSQLRVALSKQIAIVALEEHADMLNQTIAMRAEQRFDELVDYDHAIRTKSRDPVDQADVNAFGQAMRQNYATTSLRFRRTTIGALERTLETDFDMPKDHKPKVVVRKEASFLSQIFGGQTTVEVLE